MVKGGPRNLNEEFPFVSSELSVPACLHFSILQSLRSVLAEMAFVSISRLAEAETRNSLKYPRASCMNDTVTDRRPLRRTPSPPRVSAPPLSQILTHDFVRRSACVSRIHMAVDIYGYFLRPASRDRLVCCNAATELESCDEISGRHTNIHAAVVH